MVGNYAASARRTAGAIEKSLGRYTVPGSFLSGHTPLSDTQARTRSWLSELQSSQLVILSLVDKKDVRNEELMEQ